MQGTGLKGTSVPSSGGWGPPDHGWPWDTCSLGPSSGGGLGATVGLCRGLSLPTVTIPGAYGDRHGPSFLLSCLSQQSHHRAGDVPRLGMLVGLLEVGREGRPPAMWALGLLCSLFPPSALVAGCVWGLWDSPPLPQGGSRGP